MLRRALQKSRILFASCVFEMKFSFRNKRFGAASRCGALLGIASLSATLLLSPAFSASARADDFATLTAGDPLYRSMAIVARNGLTSANSNALISRARSGSRNTNALLTRYEMALQVAEAIYTATARHDADASWDATAPLPALRELQTLTTNLRPELQKLGVDTGAALRLLQMLTKPVTPAAIALSSTRNDGKVRDNADSLLNSTNWRSDPSRDGISLARRFRVDSALSALERESEDSLGNGVPNRVQGAGLAFDVAPGLSLRAAYQRRDLNQKFTDLSTLGLQTPSPLKAGEEHSLKGGLDFSLRSGLLFSTQIEKIAPEGSALGATRLTGGVGLSAWQNRLSLVAKLSRLQPEDMNALAPSTLAGVNLGVDVSQNMSLNLLYQHLFSAPSSQRSGVFAGGVSIKF